MENTSMGYHTFAFFQKIDFEEECHLDNDFIGYMRKTGKLKRTPIKNKDNAQIGWQFSYKDNKDKGIYWVMFFGEAKNNYVTRGVLSVINPKSLLEDDYIVAAEESDLKEVEEIYNREVEKISKVLLKLGACSINRVDPCLNIDMMLYHFLEIFVQIVPYGDFYKKDKAVESIRREVKDIRLRRKMLRLLTLIPEKKSLYLAQKVMNYRNVEKIMEAFAEIDVSPVTISKRQDIKYLANIYGYLVG